MTTTTNRHAAPWTARRILAALFLKPQPRRRAPRTGVDHVLTGREAVARHLYGEAVHWTVVDMAEYDHDALLRGGWLAEADRRIAGGSRISTADAEIAEWYGLTLTQWDGMSSLAKVDKREGYAQARGLAS